MAAVSGDPSKAFAFQFGSLGPDLMKVYASVVPSFLFVCLICLINT